MTITTDALLAELQSIAARGQTEPEHHCPMCDLSPDRVPSPLVDGLCDLIAWMQVYAVQPLAVTMGADGQGTVEVSLDVLTDLAAREGRALNTSTGPDGVTWLGCQSGHLLLRARA